MRQVSWPGGRHSLLLLWFLLAASPAWALTSDQIALVVNAKVPDGRALAELYAKQRHLPAGRIIEVDLDPITAISPAEEMPFDDYAPKVAAPVRAFLLRNHLKDRVTCLVTFWGMPLRIARRRLTTADRAEVARLDKELEDTRVAIATDVTTLEQSAAQLDPSFKPREGQDVQHLAKRLDATVPQIIKALPAMKDPVARVERYTQLVAVIGRLMGGDRTTQLISQPSVALFAPHPPAGQDLAAANARLADVERQIAALQSDGASVSDREKAATLARENLGNVGLAFLLAAQRESLDTDQSESALDSELSLLWWTHYPKARWVPNPLEWRTQKAWRERHVQPPSTLMVTRLDGPSQMIVRDIILTSVKVEAEGLRGQAAIDARGRTGTDPYAEYDEHLRRLADLLRQKTKLQVTLDNQEALIPANSLRDIAVYCGWYSLRNFTAPGSFSPGAVGYHVASFELASLRLPGEHGWVRGLLTRGVVGSLGPVAEPYLQSFPPPDEFFPLLMTGRLTLGEVYWRTLPWSSWMQTCIGDPLYNPYKIDPPLKVDDLPADLRGAISSDPATQPAASQPAFGSR